MAKEWVLKEKPDKEYRQKFSKYSKFLQTILYHRGIRSVSQAEAFFEWDWEKGNHDPGKLLGMKRAVARIKKALNKKEKIAIYGDYDADGVTAVVVLYKFFEELGIKPVVYIPNRITEGYGLNIEAGKYLREKGVDLVITVDSGVRNVKEVSSFNKRGMEVIVTDHHLPPSKLPKAVAVIDPHRKDDSYPFKELAGVGVAFKLVQALIKELGENNFSVGFEKWLLDLVCIGTVADLVPLVGENRVLVKYGLIVLSKTKRLGLKALMEKAGMNLQAGTVRCGEVAFQIGPRINAAGRMDHANSAFVLLRSNKEKRARELAEELNIKNRRRQEATTKIMKEAEKQDWSQEKIILTGSKDWPQGILGLVAGRLCDKFYRPALIFNEERGIIKGSARSIPGFNIVGALESVKNLLEEYGGHKQAAGFTLKRKNWLIFKKRMEELADKKLDSKKLVPKLGIDCEVDFSDFSNGIMDDLRSLEPFGFGNEEPVFLLKKALVENVSYVGKDKSHVKFVFKDGNGGNSKGGIAGIGFGLAQKAEMVEKGTRLDLVFNLMCNYFNGSEYLELSLIDWEVSG